MTLSLRPANPSDDAFLFALYASTRADELSAWGWSDAQRDAFLKMQLAAQRQDYRARYPEAEHHIILRDGRPAGRLLVSRAGPELRVVDIALLPEHRGAGVGTALLKDLLAEAEQAGKPVRLHVLKTNRAARLYTRLGFSIAGDEDPFHLQMEWRPPR